MFKPAFIVLSVAASAMATVFVTQPIATTTCVGGQRCQVAWQDDGSDPSLDDFGNAMVSVYVGNAQQQTMLQPINGSVSVADVANLEFTVDASIGPDGDAYFIRFESLTATDPDNDAIPALAFSSRFTLSGMRGTFNASVQAQIDGTSTAPLPGPTSTANTAASTTAAAGGAAGSSSRTGTATSSTAKPSSSSSAGEKLIISSATGLLGAAAAVLGLAL